MAKAKAVVKADDSKGVALSSALHSDATYESEHTIIVSIKEHGAPEVTMTGFWNGQLLSAAIRGIEKQYNDVRRHATVYAMKKSQGVNAA